MCAKKSHQKESLLVYDDISQISDIFLKDVWNVIAHYGSFTVVYTCTTVCSREIKTNWSAVLLARLPTEMPRKNSPEQTAVIDVSMIEYIHS